MSVDRCVCHGQPANWCPGAAGAVTSEMLIAGETIGSFQLPVIGPDNVPHSGTAYPGAGYECDVDCPGWHPGVIVHAYTAGVCAICGGQYEAGSLVAKMPLPTYGQNYAHEICPTV